MAEKKRWRTKLFVGAVIALVAFGVYWWTRRPAMKAEEAKQLVRIADQAIANLENEAFREGFETAEIHLQELKKRLPENVFAYRNLVISRILFFKENKKDLLDDQSFIDGTEALINELIERDQDSYESYILAFRWRYYLTNDVGENELALLESAIQNAGNSPVPFYEYFDRTSVLDEEDFPGLAEKRSNYLAKAYELQPDNVRLATFYLQQLAEQESEIFPAAWEQFKEQLLAVLISSDLELLETKQRDFVTKIDKAVEDNNARAILLGVLQLSNLIKRGEVLKIDLARIQPYELEFMVFRLPPEITELAAEQSDVGTPDSIAFGEPESIEMNELVAVRAIDVDLDFDLEIAGLSKSEFKVFRKNEDGKWDDFITLPLSKAYVGFLAADLDYDKRTAGSNRENDPEDNQKSNLYSDPDFVFFGPEGIDIYRNQIDADGNRFLEKADSGDLNSVSGVRLATLVDIDHDKDLDLLTYGQTGIDLFLSRGNLSFYKFSDSSVMPPPTSQVVSMDVVDFDRDIDIDIVLGFANQPPGYLENLGHSRLRFRNFDPSFTSIQNGARVYAVEMDRRPSWDLVSDSADGLILTTTRTSQSSVQQRFVSKASLTAASLETISDFNNDGFLDFVCSSGGESKVITGNLASLLEEPASLTTGLRMIDSIDLNQDGLVDLIGVSNDRTKIQILFNKTQTENEWLNVSVCGRDSNFDKGRINNHAIGSFVELLAGDHYFATTTKRPQLHFGLGKNNSIDLVRFLWTSGMPQSLVNVQSGQNVYEEMFEKGSCPYIYTWDGNKFSFFGDCLWAAPIGLQSAPGKFIPCRNWEYLKISGDQLKPRDGQYVLQLTEELREAAYFDLVKLYAIDHPADYDIFTNEKVGPGFIAEHKIHTVEKRHYPVTATNSSGKDVLGDITRLDQRYFKGFEKRIGKGLAPLHYLELDLGDLKELGQDQQLTLFLNGWIRPTDCSLNISYSQNPEEPSPIPPILLVPDKTGKWVKRIDPMGFPGGKPKTIAVDLTRAFLCDDYRVRIQTSHEIYWDEVFFTIGPSKTDWQQTELKTSSADLHYRGFSKRFSLGPNQPEIYDYYKVNKTPRWPAMTGKFTRYGDVKELIEESDDCSVVIGAGDEMTICFESIPDPPQGWTRDFVIHLVGYDKDGDLNTVTGQSSEPLPFRSMSTYPYGPDENFPQSEKHDRYLNTFQTRTQNWARYWLEVSPTDPE